eukprot:5282950-Alexandrium_andersonii.AAC.1
MLRAGAALPYICCDTLAAGRAAVQTHGNRPFPQRAADLEPRQPPRDPLAACEGRFRARAQDVFAVFFF